MLHLIVLLALFALGQNASAAALPIETDATSPATCPTDISGGVYQFPHLIVPTSPQAPDHSFGNSYVAYISPTNTTLFNFDIPYIPPYTGTCSLIFTFPFANEIDQGTGQYYYSGIEQVVLGNGGVEFAQLSSYALAGTTYASTPSVSVDFGKTQLLPGHSYTIATFPCPKGQTVGFSATSVNRFELDYFQNSAPKAIGLWIVPCTG